MSISKDDEKKTLESSLENQDDLWCNDDLLSQAYDMYLSQSKPTVLMTCDLPISTTVEVDISSKQTMENHEPTEESENESLFDGDFSDQDPSYLPADLHHPTTSESEDSELIQLDELLNPDRCLNKKENIKEMRSKAIALLFGKPKQLPKNNESQCVAQTITEDIFKLTWKVIQPRSRWSRQDPATWKKNLAKRRRAEGLPYVTKMKYREPKLPKPINCSKCKFDCNSHVTENIRKELCRKYWNLDYISKKQFILSIIEVKPTKRILLNRKRSTQRKYSKQCFFIIEGEKKNVCQDFFCRTLSISPHVIADAVKHRNSLGQYSKGQDPRGRREPPNKTSSEMVEAVKKHIASFPSMESHYVRKKLKRRYLDTGLTLSKMYALYVEECKNKNNEPIVSEMTYRRIFSTEFNLGFLCLRKTNVFYVPNLSVPTAKKKANYSKIMMNIYKGRKHVIGNNKKINKELKKKLIS
ncbi:uncharacterized protein [Maniola hyperantus]|uniref:uncharacterized protein n=1 Tax=Aphantopus hyperantus TaxID=2795564 RepID=UPI00374A8EDA